MSTLGAEPSGELPRAWVDRVLDVGRSLSEEQWSTFSLPVPSGRLSRLLRFAVGTQREQGEELVLWSPGDGCAGSLLGWGAARTLAPTGSGRFEALRRDAERLFAAYRETTPGEPSPRLFGGLAFSPGVRSLSAWAHHGDSRFILPRLCYEQRGERALLRLVLSGREARQSGFVEGWLRRLQGLHLALEIGEPPRGASCHVLERQEEAPGTWRQRVEAIASALQGGQLTKVVAAREVKLAFAAPPTLDSLLASLLDASETSTAFAFGFGPALFLGSSPERLITRQGLEVRTEALAGSAEGSNPSSELGLAKNLSEHSLVVQAVLDAMTPLCEHLEVPDAPVIRNLPALSHLHTPFVGRLREPRHVLSLVEALHPTPAVGGVPTPEAVDWIVRHEGFERGWYSGPVGWFDSLGDGSFVVGLRSGLLQEKSARLYAGAGIVEGSLADHEFEETRWKLRTLLQILGVDR